MHSILADKTSLLANYEVEDLVNKKKTIYFSFINGVSGATSPVLSDNVVSGAVYSAYTLWNIVNGSISDSIQKYTENLVDGKLVIKIIKSNNYHLQMYGLRHIDQSNPSFSELL